MSESPYIRLVKNKAPEPDPQYVHDLVVLRAIVRQEDRQGDVGWGGTWTKERYQRLREYPEALMAFEAELRWAKEEAQLRWETFERYKDSPYLEGQKRAYPAIPDKDGYLEKIGRLRHVMILFKLGYGSREMAMLKVNSSKRYPEAREAFERELEGLWRRVENGRLRQALERRNRIHTSEHSIMSHVCHTLTSRCF